jgi:hypothetical protein
MEIIIDKKLFLTKFLIPVNKFTDQAILSVNKDFMDCISTTTNDKQSIILYTKLDVKTDMKEDNIKLNIGSLKKLINALNCVNEPIIKLDIEKNHIAYNSVETNFKFHLKEDGTIEKPAISLDKINTINGDTELTILPEKIDELLKASSFSVDSEKVYLTIKDNIVIGELTDKTIQNLDSISVILTDKITGTEIKESIALKLDIFKIISSLKYDKLTIKITKKGVLVFEIKDDNYLMKYITSSLIK